MSFSTDIVPRLAKLCRFFYGFLKRHKIARNYVVLKRRNYVNAEDRGNSVAKKNCKTVQN